MLRLSKNLAKAKTNKRGGASQLSSMPFRRREKPVVRGFDITKLGKRQYQGNALQDHVQFNAMAWRFNERDLQSNQNIVLEHRFEGSAAMESSIPNKEKMWDPSWGELDSKRREFVTRKMIPDRKMVPKIQLPPNFSLTESKFKPYVCKKVALDTEIDTFRKYEPISSYELYQKIKKQREAQETAVQPKK